MSWLTWTFSASRSRGIFGRLGHDTRAERAMAGANSGRRLALKGLLCAAERETTPIMDPETTKIVGALGMVVLAVGGLFGVMRYLAQQRENVLARFAAFAQRHPGLKAVVRTEQLGAGVPGVLARQYPAIEGSYGGAEVVVYFSLPPNAAQDGSVRRTLFVAHPPGGLPAGLMIRPRSLFDALGRASTTGDPAFDDHFAVEARDEDALRRFLTPRKRAALLDTARHSPELGVYESLGVTLYLKGLHSDPRTLEYGLTLATALARELRSS